jgi:hypothetical protein
MKQGPRVVKPRLGNEGSDRRRGDGVAVEAQMLYGVHVFARAKVIPDLAVSRGDEAYPNASEMGDPTLSFSAAGGTAMAHLDLGDADGMRTRLERATACNSVTRRSPSSGCHGRPASQQTAAGRTDPRC